MAKQILGKVVPIVKGTYNSSTQYAILDIVEYNGSSYIAKTNVQGQAPTNTTYWQLLAKQGDKPVYKVDYLTDDEMDEIVADIISDSTNAFNQNVTAKTTAFNNNATDKTTAFNSNATSKTNDFNTNASSKTTAFNSNASDKQSDFNSNASSTKDDFDRNATAKTEAYDDNASSKLSAYNDNATSKVNAYNNNHTDKLGAYNSNDTAKTTAYNDNATAKTTAFNENYEDKIDLFDEHSEELQAEVDRYKTLENALPHVNEEGESITLNDTANSPLDLELEPIELEQETTEGYNLFRIADGIYSAGAAPTREITVKDGIITNVNYSTATASFGIAVPLVTPITLKANQSYTRANLNDAYPYINLKNNDDDIDSMNYADNGIKTFTPTEDVVVNQLYLWFAIRSYNEIKPIMVKGTYTSETLPEFEKGTDGASPNPDYPQDIHTISGDNTVKVENKNLLPLKAKDLTLNNYIGNDGSEQTSSTGNYYGSFTYIDFKYSGRTITLSNGIEVAFYDKDKTFIRYVGRTESRTFTAPSNSKYIRIDCYKDNINEMQIELGSTATTYVPHQEQIAELNLGDLEYCKIGDYKDRFFKNIPEDADYDETREIGKWYLKKNIGKVVLDGTETYIKSYAGSPNAGHLFKTVISDMLSASNDDIVVSLLCSHYKNGYSYANLLYANIGTDGIAIAQNHTLTISSATYTYDNDLDAFKNFLSNNNVGVYYPLATPNYTLLNNTLQSQLETIYNKLLGYQDQTNISQENNDLAFNIKAKANVEIQELLDEKVQQYSTMPTASADYVGKIVQYIGATGTYTNGYFYKGTANGSSYSWTQVNVQPASSISGYEQTSNKVTSLSSSSTDTQYPSAKCVYDEITAQIGNINTILATLTTPSSVSE